MKRILSAFVILLLIGMTVVPAPAQDSADPKQFSRLGRAPWDEPKGEFILLDVAILRPAGAAATVIGLGTSVVAYPFASFSGTTADVDRELVYKPWDYTFCRPIGQFDWDYRDR